MSTSENISLWKKKSEIDYIPLFISLWFSLNAWMRDRFDEPRDRDRLEWLKRGGHPLSEQFSGLVQANDARASRFKGSLGELHRALVNANVSYEGRDNIVSFESCAIDWNNGDPSFESVLKGSAEQEKLEIDNGLWVDNDTGRLFAAYMEIVYQIRCALFHGDLAPVDKNERAIRHLYLTLSIVMERV